MLARRSPLDSVLRSTKQLLRPEYIKARAAPPLARWQRSPEAEYAGFMAEVNRILDQLHRAYDGPAWHGPALREILAGVTWQTAALHPITGAHTIWELVLHLTVWMSVVTRRI